MKNALLFLLLSLAPVTSHAQDPELRSRAIALLERAKVLSAVLSYKAWDAGKKLRSAIIALFRFGAERHFPPRERRNWCPPKSIGSCGSRRSVS